MDSYQSVANSSFAFQIIWIFFSNIFHSQLVESVDVNLEIGRADYT